MLLFATLSLLGPLELRGALLRERIQKRELWLVVEAPLLAIPLFVDQILGNVGIVGVPKLLGKRGAVVGNLSFLPNQEDLHEMRIESGEGTR